MLNDKPCGTCRHFDPVMRGNNKGLRKTAWGWCAKRSVYPAKEGPGQVFPVGVKRVSNPASPAQPKIVKVLEVVGNCNDFQERPAKDDKAALINTLKAQRGGRLA